MFNEIFGVASFIVTFILMVLMYRCFWETRFNCLESMGTIIANIQVIKTIHIFEFQRQNVMFTSIYLATDILNDIYGRKVAKRAVWLGFSSTLSDDYCYANDYILFQHLKILRRVRLRQYLI